MNELSLFTGAGGGLLGTMLLGFHPIGWTDLKPLEMDRSACAPPLPGKSFQKWLDINLKMLETILNGGFQYEQRKDEQDLQELV